MTDKEAHTLIKDIEASYEAAKAAHLETMGHVRKLAAAVVRLEDECTGTPGRERDFLSWRVKARRVAAASTFLSNNLSGGK